MTEYNFDGEIHAIDEEFAYIIERIDAQKLTNKKYKDNELLKDVYREFYRKYAEYLYKYDKEKIIEYLLSVFNNYLVFEQTPEYISLIYRPPDIASVLSQYATAAMKFKRSKGDGLG